MKILKIIIWWFYFYFVYQPIDLIMSVVSPYSSCSQIDISQTDIETVQREVDFMRGISSKYIVAYYGSFTAKNYYYVWMLYLTDW